MKYKNLTFTEKMVVGMVIREAHRSMLLNDETGEFEDDSSFVMTLDKKDMEALTRAVKKI